ncbi:transmembrane protein 241 [Bombina bombina]|uniref:transmembrane protein 241 n=1 Tax=Bombina bombina TaxID=8345 RepID=UPI00235A6EE3|nr:transmembrane protein 241 [Bombina bombina]
MYFRGPLVGLTFCCFFLASYFTNKYVLSVLKFTYPTLFQGWQTLVGGLLLHVCWKLGWVEINSSSSLIFPSQEEGEELSCSRFIVVGSSERFEVHFHPQRAATSDGGESGVLSSGTITPTLLLSLQPIPVFFILHNAAETVVYGVQRVILKEQSSYTRSLSIILMLISAGFLPLHDAQFDADGYFWATVHLACVGCYKVFQKSQKSSTLSELDQQYINYVFSVILLAFASHPTGDLLSALEFPFLYFYRFHWGCCASGILGFLLMLTTTKLKSSLSSAHHASWGFLAKILTAVLSLMFFDIIMTVPLVICFLIGFLGDALLIYSERTGA